MPDDPAGEQSGLPYVDEHRIMIAAPPDRVWTALRRYVDSFLRRAAPLGWLLLGTEPPGGFEVSREVPNQHLGLAGRHRFARYLLTFDLVEREGGTTLLSARSYAAFPGLHGRVYRALVIGTGGHVLGVKHILRAIRRAS